MESRIRILHESTSVLMFSHSIVMLEVEVDVIVAFGLCKDSTKVQNQSLDLTRVAVMKEISFKMVCCT